MLRFALMGRWALEVLEPSEGEPPGEGAPVMQFNDELNSQLLALLEDF
jgi:hypothetical protein